MILGTLVYNEILVLPCGGFDQWTKEAIAQRDGASKKNQNYMATSPGAAYSSQRNQRLLQKGDDQHYEELGDDADEYQMNNSDSHK